MSTEFVDDSPIYGSPAGLPSSQGPTGSGYAPRYLPPGPSWDYRNPYTPERPVYSNPQGTYNPPNYTPPPPPANPRPYQPINEPPSFRGNGYDPSMVNRGYTPSTAGRDAAINNRPINPPRTSGEYLGIESPAGSRTNFNNPYQPSSPSPSGSLGSNPGGSNRNFAPTGSNPTGPNFSPGRFPPDFSQNPPTPPGQNRPMGGAPMGENPGGPPVEGPTNFDQYFGQFMDNFYGGQIEPPVTPPFQGGQDLEGIYEVEFTVTWSWVNWNRDRTATGQARARQKMRGRVTASSGNEGNQYGGNPSWILAQLGIPRSITPNGYVSGWDYQLLWDNGVGLGGNNTIGSTTITRVTRLNGPSTEQDNFPSSPGTSAPPNTNLGPLGLLGLDPLTTPGLDPLSQLDPGLFPGGQPGTDSPPAIDPTQHPDTYNPPSPFPPDQIKPLPDNLSLPSMQGGTDTQTSTQRLLGGSNSPATSTSVNNAHDPYNNRSYGYPSTTSLSPGRQSPNTQPNLPETTTNPLTGTQSPVIQTPNDPNTPNPPVIPPHDCDNPTDPCEASRKRQLDRIENNTRQPEPPNLSGTIETKRCEEIRDLPPKPNDPDEQTFNYSGQGFLGIKSQIDAISKQIEAVRKDFCHIKTTLSVPDAWSIRTQPNRPQLVIIFANVIYEQGKEKLGKSRWSFTIPHFDINLINNVKLPRYDKGDWMAIAELKDGSKIVVNAVNEVTAKRICRLALTYVLKSMQIDPKEIKVTPRKGKIPQKTVIPVLAHYYSGGRALNSEGEVKPSITVQLRKKEND